MRIGIDLRLHPYAPGGISRYARTLARHLAPLLAGDADALHLLYHRKEQTPLELPTAHAHRAWTPPHHRLERWALGLELLPQRLDLFHATDFVPPAWGARHTVVTVHDLSFLYYPEHLTAEARRYYNDQIHWAVQRADALISVSHATKRDLVRRLGVAPSRVTVVHPLSEDAVQAVLDRHGLAPGYLLFVGTWEPRKNLTGLLSAFAALRAADADRELVIVGRPGWLYDEIFARVEALGVTDHVHFIERVALGDLVALYNGALLHTLPSFYEGFGFPALEAMACGTPTVVADRASLPEVVGDAGLLVDPEEPATLVAAFRRLHEDATLRKRLRQAGLERAATFTWDAAARRTLDVYRATVG
jgi:glycosyltransferase involved in cell wall biosynthesis